MPRWAMCAAGYTMFAINHRAAPCGSCASMLSILASAQTALAHVVALRAGILVSLLGRQASACAVDGADPVNRQDASVQCLVARAPLVDLTRLVTGNGSGIVASFIGMPYCGEASDGYATAHRAHREASSLSHVLLQRRHVC